MIAPNKEVAFARLKDDRVGILTGICLAVNVETETVWICTDSKHFLVHIDDVVVADDEEAFGAFSQKLYEMFPNDDCDGDHWKDANHLADKVQELLARPPRPLPEGIFYPPLSVFRHRRT